MNNNRRGTKKRVSFEEKTHIRSFNKNDNTFINNTNTIKIGHSLVDLPVNLNKAEKMRINAYLSGSIRDSIKPSMPSIRQIIRDIISRAHSSLYDEILKKTERLQENIPENDVKQYIQQVLNTFTATKENNINKNIEKYLVNSIKEYYYIVTNNLTYDNIKDKLKPLAGTKRHRNGGRRILYTRRRKLNRSYKSN
jgi:hypothetical protein